MKLDSAIFTMPEHNLSEIQNQLNDIDRKLTIIVLCLLVIILIYMGREFSKMIDKQKN